MEPDFYISANREVLWNVGSPINQVIMYSLFALSMAVCINGLWARIILWSKGKSDPTRFKDWFTRLNLFWTYVVKQRKVNEDPEAKIFHKFLFLGFLVLLFTTTMVFIDNDLGIKIYHGPFYLLITFYSDIFGFLLIVGTAIAYHRRVFARPDKLHTTRSDFFLLGMLALLCIQGFILEGLRIFVTDDPWKEFSPVGYGVSLMFWGLSPHAASLLHFITWWAHTVAVFLFFALLPYTKFLHVLASSANLFFQRTDRPKGALSYPGNIESLLESAAESESGEFSIGVSTVNELTWKQRLDLDACTSCGRCQDVCPAYNSGKPLSPKWLILDTRNHLLTLNSNGAFAEPNAPISGLKKLDGSLLQNMLLAPEPSGVGDGPLSIRANNPLVQNAGRSIGGSADATLAGDVMDPNVFWSCTTCRACMEVCPVGIEHVDLIIDVRRSKALMEGDIPSEAQASLRAIETRGNPFGPADDRADWSNGLDVPILKEGDKVEVLYWIGCISAYDKRKQSIARSMVQILNASGLSWGILGNRECCTGDPARRLGEENLFQTSAKKSIEVLRTVTFSTVVANCPHCFNSIKNEYPDIGEIAPGRPIRVVHHTQLIHELMENGKIKTNASLTENVTFHDPCYLGRYNDTYDQPRDVLVQLGRGTGMELNEMAQNREKGKCCGAGGGHFWMDLKIGDRVNVQRIEQAAATGAKKVATACPFCMHMLQDGLKLTDREDSMEVLDIAELVAQSLTSTASH